MRTNMSQISYSRRLEQGAALVVSLILLLIMTIIGISAMNGARLEVSMAGMMQREELALRAAERTLTAAERYIENKPVPLDDSIDGHYPAENDLDTSVTDWTEIVSVNKTGIPQLSGLGEKDELVVEDLGEFTAGGHLGELMVGDEIHGDRFDAYRITTRSETEGKAVRIVESTYTK
ncbi:Uncharacterised protein [Halioglobus japonicus]|nr:Uncharacterised protein [Halioglobus japonicus]